MQLAITTLVILLLLQSVVSDLPTKKEVTDLFEQWTDWENEGIYNENTLFEKVLKVDTNSAVAFFKQGDASWFLVFLCKFLKDKSYKITHVSPKSSSEELDSFKSSYTEKFAFAFKENWNQFTRNQITLCKTVRTCTLELKNRAWIITTTKVDDKFYFKAELSPKGEINYSSFTFSSCQFFTQYDLCTEIKEFLQYHLQLSEWESPSNNFIYKSVRNSLPEVFRGTNDHPPTVVQRSFSKETQLFAKVTNGNRECALIALRVRKLFGQDSVKITHLMVIEEHTVEREVERYIRSPDPFMIKYINPNLKEAIDSVKMESGYTLVSAFGTRGSVYGIYLRKSFKTYKFVHFVRIESILYDSFSLVVEKTQDGTCKNEEESCEEILKYRLSHRRTDNTEGFLALSSDIIPRLGLGSTTANVQLTETCIVDDEIIGFYKITQNKSVQHAWVAIISRNERGNKKWVLQKTEQPCGTEEEMLNSLYLYQYVSALY